MDNLFFFISPEVEFQETTVGGGARLVATVMELEKISGNNKLYRIEEGEEIAKSLVGVPVYYGTDWKGKHDNPFVKSDSKQPPVGFVETAKVLGNKIKAWVHITSDGIIETLKQGVKYLFSVGGNAISETIKKIGEKVVHILYGARCNHLQIVPLGTPIGFPNAKTEKIIEINETIMFCGDEDKPIIPTPAKTAPIEETVEFSGDIIGYECIEEK